MRFERYNRIAQYYPAMWRLLVPGYVHLLNAMQEVVLVRKERPRAILDLGCGPGSATIAAAPGCADDGRVTLVDGSSKMLEVANELMDDQSRQSIHGDFTDPALLSTIFPREAYDLVLCSFALHHLSDHDKRLTIERIGKSLKPDGILLLADELSTDRPGGWDLIERVRARIIKQHLDTGQITHDFWAVETSLPPEMTLPFVPCKREDLISWMARAGLAVGSPVHIFGSGLFVGLKKMIGS